MSDEEKKEFFNKIDAAWNAKGEKNEELTGNQHKLDVDGDGEIEASDLAALRAGKKKEESIEESAGCGCGCGCGGSKMNEEFKSKDSTFEKVYGIFDKKDYFNAKGLAKTQIGNFERALQRNDKGAQQILDKFNGDMEKSKEYIIQVISDQKKAQAFEDYKALFQSKYIKNRMHFTLRESYLSQEQLFELHQLNPEIQFLYVPTSEDYYVSHRFKDIQDQ